MIPKRWEPLLDRLHDEWRDRILTALTLLLVVHLFIVAPLESHALHIQPIGAVFVVLLSIGLLILSRSLVPVFGILAVVGLLAVAVVMRIRGGHVALDVSLQATAWLLIALVIIWTVARAVFGPGRITYHRIVGAIMLYLTIGLVFVALYTLVGAYSPNAFSGTTITAHVSLPSDLVYFSFTTLTTLGYGDIMPVHPIARSLSNVEAIIGQVYPATLLARARRADGNNKERTMKFGVTVVPRISDWKLFVDLEAMGYDAAWAADSQMLYSDAYATLALAAVNTSRIRLGTGVSVAGVRLAPVTAHSIATINKLAPGRTFLGIGTGHTAMRVMGKDPVKAREFRDYLRVLRALLHGQEVDYALGDGAKTDIRFLHPKEGFIDVEHPVPIYVAADGPLALKTAGAYGDGRVCSHNQTKARLQKSLEAMREGASAVGRTLPDTFHTTALSYACVLRPGESMTSDRVIDEIGPMAAATLHYWWELYQMDGDTSTVAGRCRDLWEEYLAFTEKMETPPAKRYQQIHLGHCAFLPPEERRFITEDLIRSTGGLVGTPDEIIAMLREREAMGLNEISLLPAMATARQNLKDFADKVIARY
jgi:alkanesulfonate monooxygenase SsuD/methylene tetrahydromethanopterin reductase-like flavin-dependent oxidoreductase (luciferase family)